VTSESISFNPISAFALLFNFWARDNRFRGFLLRIHTLLFLLPLCIPGPAPTARDPFLVPSLDFGVAFRLFFGVAFRLFFAAVDVGITTGAGPTLVWREEC
jgi:hypothetical protein